MKVLRALLPLAFLGLCAYGLLRISLQGESVERETHPADQSLAQPLYIAHQATWVRYGEDHKPQLRAQAERIDYYEDHSMKLTQVRLDRLGAQNGPWQASAPQGYVPPGESRMRLQPDVVVKGMAPKSLPTEINAREVWVDWQSQQLYSRSPVRAKAPGRSASAQSWTSDFAGNHVQLNGQVEMHYDAPPR